jgi:xylulokinase
MAPPVAEARGCFYGLTAAHGPEHLTRAVLEGCAFAMRDVVDRLTALGADTGRVRLLSGGARSRVWAEIRAGLLDRPVEVAAVSDSSPLGAALLAAVAAGAEPSLDSAADKLAPQTVEIEPWPASRRPRRGSSPLPAPVHGAEAGSERLPARARR